ncbi:hypothetical protein LCGC14_0111200 [marine sediment metagenome]|jgi:type I restriction enzyme S subunit|uniref:Restriction endonuclease subunit S n=2 Tax=root TaxID=1 RepID=A0A7V1FMH2_9RHOB|nr:restriction endonuclease subunit S [Sulfitobacter litoralis]HDZ51572.1 restriction endonuclease subunit S [Sulfitobacter litoralis]
MSEASVFPNWRKALLGDVASCTLGGTPSTEIPLFWGGDIPWMASGDVHLRRIHDVPGRITKAGLTSCNATMTRPPAVAVGLAGQGKTRGTVALTLRELCTNQSIALLKGDQKNLLTEFLFHNLERRYEELRARSSGGGRGGLSKGILEQVPMELPSLPVQSKIAEILDTLDAAIRGTEAVVAKLKAMKQGLLHDLLTRGIDANGDLRPPQPEAPHLYKQTPLGWLPREWDCLELGAITRELAQGWSPDCPSEPALAHEWGVLKTTTVVWSGYQEHENKRLPEGLRPRPHLQVEVDDILITRAGPSSRVAVVAHVPATRSKLMISDKLYRLRVSGEQNPAFTAAALSSIAVQREIGKTISGMAESQTNISQATLKPLPVPVPSKWEQDAIMVGIEAQSQKLKGEEELLNKLRLQKSGLMDDLLTGRKPVTDLL